MSAFNDALTSNKKFDHTHLWPECWCLMSGSLVYGWSVAVIVATSNFLLPKICLRIMIF